MINTIQDFIRKIQEWDYIDNLLFIIYIFFYVFKRYLLWSMILICWWSIIFWIDFNIIKLITYYIFYKLIY